MANVKINTSTDAQRTTEREWKGNGIFCFLPSSLILPLLLLLLRKRKRPCACCFVVVVVARIRRVF